MTETTQKVLDLLKTHNRVVLVFRNRKELEMAKRATKKTAKKSSKKVTMTKPQAVDAAMKAVEADKKKRAKKETGKMSGLDAAAQVLAEAKKPMTTKEMVEVMLAKGLWTTKGATPASTLYSALIREIANRKDASRFKKTGPGEFALAK